ncbi:hypothetical protein [Georgenia sp. MJ170]|uniref:hypothetical protein n=1 Tax=Georgenia sunbinii TaxID=3117728 RepID=UPI002F26AF7E
MTSPTSVVRTSVALAATALLLVGCSANDEPAPDEAESTSATESENGAGASTEPGLATCEFNNELDDHQGDGSGVSPYGQLESAELREEADAYVVTLTGDFFDPGVLLADGGNGSLQVMLHGEDYTAPAPTLMTEFRAGEMEFSGTFLEQEQQSQQTGAVLEDGTFTATYPKDSPHLEGFEPTMWTASVYFDDGDESVNPVSFRCGDGRSLDWEPLA